MTVEATPQAASGAPRSHPAVLIVEDDPAVRRILRDLLTDQGYRVTMAAAGKEALADPDRLRDGLDVVLLDLGLPDMSGLQVLRCLRRLSDVPVVALSTDGDTQTRITALDLGADDCLPKFCALPELFARIHAAARKGWRSTTGLALELRRGPFTFNLTHHNVRFRGELLPFSDRDVCLLEILASEPTRRFDRTELAWLVWEEELTPKIKVMLATSISRLRDRCVQVGIGSTVVETIGRGYQFAGVSDD